MKIVSFVKEEEEKYGLYYQDKIYDLFSAAKKLNTELPEDILFFLAEGEQGLEKALRIEEEIKSGNIVPENRNEIHLIAPVPNPVSCRDGYAFRQHVETARRNRGVDMIPEFDQFPIFYFTNHNAVFGEGDIQVEEDHLIKLDFELEAAVIIGKYGKNIRAEDADKHIAGYTIMNDFSARHLQMEEMKLNLGPAKGKDFATSIGPWLVTPDELKDYLISSDEGDKYDLRMTALHNGRLVSDGNMKDMNWSFAEIIERISYGVEVFPGEVIGSGTVGTGCYLELNGTWALEAKKKGEEFTPIWLKDGDVIELEITGLGILKNRIVKTNNNYSILKKNKNVSYKP
jgi:fumarylacetoacetate (FAA) hydrolase